MFTRTFTFTFYVKAQISPFWLFLWRRSEPDVAYYQVHVLATGCDDSSLVHKTRSHLDFRVYRTRAHEVSENIEATLKF